MTTAERARKRATKSRIRAICRNPGVWYDVFNLNKHVKYRVWFDTKSGLWECQCMTNNLKYRCKHVQRVMDREERRIRQEALQHG